MNLQYMTPIMQLVRRACIFRGQVSVLQYAVVGPTMILFSLQCDRLFLEVNFVLVHATRLHLKLATNNRLKTLK